MLCWPYQLDLDVGDMAEILSLTPISPSYKIRTPRHQKSTARPKRAASASSIQTWTLLSRSVTCNARFSCLFSDNRRQEEARKALESALGGKKTEFEKWDKEIKKRQETSGGGDSGGGGWFRWGGWFGGGWEGDRFWQEVRQASLAILGILVFFLIVAKGDVMLAVIFNPILFTLRGSRAGLTLLISKIKSRLYGGNFGGLQPQEEAGEPARISAKERVVGKWGNS